MPNFLCLTLSEISDIAQIGIAVANLILLVYIFIYTRSKDKKDVLRNIKLQEQSVNLQWFKELIIQPHIDEVFQFYKEIITISERLLEVGINDAKKIKITDDIKQAHTKIRKSFVDVLRAVDSKIEIRVKTNLDTLIGDLTIAVFDKGINLAHPPAYEKEILNKIIYSKNDLISIIYSFNGNKF